MQHITELLEIIGGQLDSVADSNIVLGKPVTLGKFKVIPLSRTSLGFGGGGGEGEGMDHHHGPPRRLHKASGDVKGKGTGGGCGGGGKVRPVGIIVFGESGVEVLPIPDKQGILDKLFEKMPDLLEKVKDFKRKSED